MAVGVQRSINLYEEGEDKPAYTIFVEEKDGKTRAQIQVQKITMYPPWIPTEDLQQAIDQLVPDG